MTEATPQPAPLPWPDLAGEPAEVEFSGGLLSAWSVEDDAPALAQAARDARIRQWNPFRIEGVEEAEHFIAERAASTDSVSWAVRGWPGGVLLGAVNLFHFEPEVRAVECGYWVAPAARGRGLAGRAVRAAAEHVCVEWGVNRVFLYHSVGNAGSCRAAAKAGFQLEGTLRQSYRYGDGALHDEHLHALLAVDLGLATGK